jgi:uncharacterized protein YgbK (DUF1537 family)
METLMPILPVSALNRYPVPDEADLQRRLDRALDGLDRKIVVLDDDPTGVQTVHDIPVYTQWSKEALREGFREAGNLFFVLTNSRSFSSEKTERVHREIAESLAAVSAETGHHFLLISRGDSTLRGHYPLETETLRRTLERLTGKKFDGEVLMPFFKEGGRYTIGNVHYVKDGDRLIPAAQTEFAKDKSFGYHSSDLAQYCEEKTRGAFPAAGVTCISIEDLRAERVEKIAEQLKSVTGFGKIVVNAIDYCDVEIFALALLRALGNGKEYLFRSAAALPRVLGGIRERPLLVKTDLVPPENKNGGIILIGSHVAKTTRQMEELRRCRYPVEFLEFNQHLVLNPGGLESEVKRVVALAEEKIRGGKTVAVHTHRKRFDLPNGSEEDQLRISVEISNALTDVIGRLTVRPGFILAKGGITSSDVGTRALGVRRAIVMGQVRPGIPVWKTGSESKFPGLPYIIFPGNVGEDGTLREIAELLLAPAGQPA